MDVFPLDYIGNTKKESLKNFRRIDLRTNLLFAMVCEVNNDRKWYKNILIKMLRIIPKFLLNHVNVLKNIEKIRKRIVLHNSKYVSNLFGNWHEKEISRKEWFGVPQKCAFETRSVYIPENYDEYLKSLYGDYMTLPPVEKRVSHHDSVYMNLNEPYVR